MKSYSQKQTNGLWISRGADGRFVQRTNAYAGSVKARSVAKACMNSSNDAHYRHVTVNKFEGMSEKVELLAPIHIPGYKIRG